MVFGGVLTSVYSLLNLVECFAGKEDSGEEETRS
jgi:hypothetical protein